MFVKKRMLKIKQTLAISPLSRPIVASILQRYRQCPYLSVERHTPFN